MIKILYYWLYKILMKTRKEDDPGIATLIVIGFMFYWNIIIIVKQSFLSSYFILSKQYATIIGIIMGALIFIPIYFLIYKKRKEIIRKVEKLSLKRYKLGKFISYLYFIGTVVSTFYVLLYT